MRVRFLLRELRLVATTVVALAACTVEVEHTEEIESATTCVPGSYTPYGADGKYPSGTVAQIPWRGPARTYPAGIEDFRGYSLPLPKTVECASDKDQRAHLDVTAGCLDVVTTGDGAYTRGRTRDTADGSFRAVAKGFVEGDPDHPVKWTDQSVEYRFYYGARTGTENNPGFKAFARYRTEDDLYVASWRTDGVVQIQVKQCGDYTPLAILPNYGAPKTGTWHWLRFDAVGDKLDLYLDNKHVLSTHDGTFSWGTAGIRIDSIDGAYLDDWRVESP